MSLRGPSGMRQLPAKGRSSVVPDELLERFNANPASTCRMLDVHPWKFHFCDTLMLHCGCPIVVLGHVYSEADWSAWRVEQTGRAETNSASRLWKWESERFPCKAAHCWLRWQKPVRIEGVQSSSRLRRLRCLLTTGSMRSSARCDSRSVLRASQRGFRAQSGRARCDRPVLLVVAQRERRNQDTTRTLARPRPRARAAIRGRGLTPSLDLGSVLTCPLKAATWGTRVFHLAASCHCPSAVLLFLFKSPSGSCGCSGPLGKASQSLEVLSFTNLQGPGLCALAQKVFVQDCHGRAISWKPAVVQQVQAECKHYSWSGSSTH